MAFTRRNPKCGRRLTSIPAIAFPTENFRKAQTHTYVDLWQTADVLKPLKSRAFCLGSGDVLDAVNPD